MYSIKPKASLLLIIQIILLNDLFNNSVQGSRYEGNDEYRRTPPRGYTPFPQFGVAYRVSSKSLSWIKARDACWEVEASLAVPDSRQKMEAMLSLNKRLRYFHVGIYRSPILKAWVRVGDAEPVNPIPWGTGWPLPRGNCVGIDAGDRHGPAGAAGLINYGCEEFEKFSVCQIPLVNK